MPSSATPGGFLLVLAIVVPVTGMLFSLVLGGRHAERVTLILMPFGVAIAMAIGVIVWRTHNALRYYVGNWDPPLGIAFRADGLSVVMVMTAALLICGIGLFARGQFLTRPGPEERAPLVFWILLLAVWGALNAVFIAGDLFNIYVALELLTFGRIGDQQFQADLAQSHNTAEDDRGGTESTEHLRRRMLRQSWHDIEPQPDDEKEWCLDHQP